MPPASSWIVPKLRGWANQMVLRFGTETEVYLVGSALRKEHPRDVDLCIVLPDQVFMARYGIHPVPEERGGSSSAIADFFAPLHGPTWPSGLRRWGREVAGLTLGVPVERPDLKVDARSRVAKLHEGKRRLRLDDLLQEAK